MEWPIRTSLESMAIIGDDGTVDANGDMSDRTQLRLVEGGDESERTVGLATVPLGPWARAAVEVWASTTGQVWHANPGCPELRHRARRAVYQQPTSGSLADLVLPDRLHCPPIGELHDYRAAAVYLASYELAGRSMVDALANHDVRVRQAVRFVESRSPVDADSGRVLEVGALAPRWAAAQRDRQGLVDRVRGVFPADGERAARICAARWVRSGRTPREHQERYARFLSVGIEELDRSGVSYRGYERNAVNRDRLPEWLEMVVDGMTPAAATAAMASDAGNGSDDTDDPVAAAWRAVGQRWEALLDGVCLGYPGDLVAVFHRYGVRNSLWKLLPHARIEVGELDWVVARLPAASRPLLAERDRGLVGLVLDDEHGHVFDADRCALLLRNILIALGCQQLSDLVTADPDDRVDRLRDADRPACPLSWQQVGFGSGVTDQGTTREVCLPAVRAAVRGTVLPSVQTPRRRR